MTGMPGAGELDRRIALQSQASGRDSETNSPNGAWSTYATVWAKMEFHGARETGDKGGKFAAYDLYFTIRHRSDVASNHRLVFENETYEIEGRPREIGRRRFLKIKAKLVE